MRFQPEQRTASSETTSSLMHTLGAVERRRFSPCLIKCDAIASWHGNVHICSQATQPWSISSKEVLLTTHQKGLVNKQLWHRNGFTDELMNANAPCGNILPSTGTECNKCPREDIEGL